MILTGKKLQKIIREEIRNVVLERLEQELYPKGYSYPGEDFRIGLSTFDDDEIDRDIMVRFDQANVPEGSKREFYEEIMRQLAATPTDEKLGFFGAWEAAEHAATVNNPLATTWPGIGNCGMTTYNMLKGKCGVKHFSTFNAGVEATVKTLTNGLYPQIIEYLRDELIDEKTGNLVTSIEQALNDQRVVDQLDRWGGTGDSKYKNLVVTRLNQGKNGSERSKISAKGEVVPGPGGYDSSREPASMATSAEYNPDEIETAEFDI